MDSIKTRITNVPQKSGFKTVLFSAGATSSNSGTANELSHIIIPKGAMVSNVCAIIQTAWNGPTTCSLSAGYPSGVAQSDTSSSVSADPDAFLAGANNMKTVNSYFMSNNSATKPAGLFDVVPMTDSATYSEAGEYVVPITLTGTLTHSSATAADAGQLVWWVEYVFDPNIVWNQDSLA